MKYLITKNTISFIISVMILFSSNAFAENPQPNFLKKDLAQLDNTAKIEILRENRTPLSEDKQAQLIAYFKGLDFKNKEELNQAVELVPYLASKLSFENYIDLLKYVILEKYYSPDIIKYCFLQEVGYMVISEKSKSSKAYKLLLEFSRMPDNKRFTYSRVYGFNGRVFIRIRRFLKFYDNILSEIDKNKQDQEMLLAAMENQLGNNPKKLFILNNKTEEEADDDGISVDENGFPVMPKLVFSYDSKKHDQCRTDTNEYIKMLVDVLSYPDPKVKMAAAKELRRYSEQNFNFNPVGTKAEQKTAISKWQKYISEHDVLKERKKALLKKFNEAKARKKQDQEKKTK